VNITKKDWDDLNRRLNIANRDIVRLTQVVCNNRCLLRRIAEYSSFYFSGVDCGVFPMDRPLISGDDPNDSLVLRAPADFVPITLNALYSNIFAQSEL